MIAEETLRNMEIHGGSFVKLLAELYRVADTNNKAKLESCFAEIFERYEKFGRR